MAKYSKVYSVGHMKFRYNYENGVLEYLQKPYKDMLEDNKEWIEKHNRPLWDIVNGYSVIDSIGLSKANWKDSPTYWCERYADELNEEAYFLMKEEFGGI